jgi:hypothetical protein
MKLVHYRIYDETDRHILASGIPNPEQAAEVLHFLQLEYPGNTLTIETYETQTVRPGFGRDPDLH